MLSCQCLPVGLQIQIVSMLCTPDRLLASQPNFSDADITAGAVAPMHATNSDASSSPLLAVPLQDEREAVQL